MLGPKSLNVRRFLKEHPAYSGGTVGAAAVDASGLLAAATSTLSRERVRSLPEATNRSTPLELVTSSEARVEEAHPIVFAISARYVAPVLRMRPT